MIPTKDTRLFLDATWNFGEVPKWFQVIPGPGSWKHPAYGEIKVTEDDLDEFAENFRKEVYQEHIPIDAEHETKMSGACGYFKKVKVGGPDGEPGLWAQADWTARGEKLLKEERYKYFSPEWYDEWADPATGKKYKNVLVGGALTTRPFFKDASLQPLVASEGFLWTVREEESDEKWEEMERVKMAEDAHVLQPIKAKKRGGKMSEVTLKLSPKQVEAIKAGEDFEFSEDQLAAVREGEPDPTPEMPPEVARNFAEIRREKDEMASALKRATEEVAQMRRESRHKEFAEFVRENRAAFQGEVDECVGTLEELVEHLPKELFDKLLAERREFSERIKASGLFKQDSVQGQVPATAKAEFEARTKELEVNGTSKSDAIARVASESPDLYERYDKEHKARIRRGGE